MPEQHLGIFGKRKAADTPYVSRHRGKFWGSTKRARVTPGNGEFDRFRRSGDCSSCTFCILSAFFFIFKEVGGWGGKTLVRELGEVGV